eukprot:3151980-Amphidinium_carterae.1
MRHGGRCCKELPTWQDNNYRGTTSTLTKAPSCDDSCWIEHHGSSDQQQLAAISDLRVEVERLNKKMDLTQQAHSSHADKELQFSSLEPLNLPPSLQQG